MIKSLTYSTFFIALAFISHDATSQIIITFAGVGHGGYTGDGGPASAAALNGPSYLTTDTAGNIYFSDFNSNVVRRVNTSGTITTIAGTGTSGYTGDGGPATAATFNFVRGIALDKWGNLFIADQNNHVIRRIDNAGTITTFAGNSTNGYSGDAGPATAAQLSYPQRIATDTAGNIFITDFYHVIRKINPSGIITTIAGTPGIGGYSGDGGPASAAAFHSPDGMCTDLTGNLYIADGRNHVIRKIDTAGIVTTIAGSNVSGYTGDGGTATAANLNRPSSVAIDTTGALYIADSWNHVIRKIAASGIINTVVGTGTSGYSGDYGLADTAKISFPSSIIFDRTNRLYIGEAAYVIRRVQPGTPTTYVTSISPTTSFTLFPNPVNQSLTLSLPLHHPAPAIVYITDVSGRQYIATPIPIGTTTHTISLHQLPIGTYTATYTSGTLSTQQVFTVVR